MKCDIYVANWLTKSAKCNKVRISVGFFISRYVSNR